MQFCVFTWTCAASLDDDDGDIARGIEKKTRFVCLYLLTRSVRRKELRRESVV